MWAPTKARTARSSSRSIDDRRHHREGARGTGRSTPPPGGGRARRAPRHAPRPRRATAPRTRPMRSSSGSARMLSSTASRCSSAPGSPMAYRRSPVWRWMNTAASPTWPARVRRRITSARLAATNWSASPREHGVDQPAPVAEVVVHGAAGQAGGGRHVGHREPPQPDAARAPHGRVDDPVLDLGGGRLRPTTPPCTTEHLYQTVQRRATGGRACRGWIAGP